VDRDEVALPVMAEIDAERIESVAERARHREQLDWPRIRLDPCRLKHIFDIGFQRSARAIAVIRVSEAKQIKPVV